MGNIKGFAQTGKSELIRQSLNNIGSALKTVSRFQIIKEINNYRNFIQPSLL